VTDLVSNASFYALYTLRGLLTSNQNRERRNWNWWDRGNLYGQHIAYIFIVTQCVVYWLSGHQKLRS